MPVKAGDLTIGDYIFLDSPNLPNFLTRRWIEIEALTIHGNPKAHLPRIGNPMRGWIERTFKLSDIVLHRTKAQVETEIPRIVSLQEMMRKERAERTKRLHDNKQMSMQDLAKKETLPHIDLLRKVILKRTHINWEFGLIIMDEELVEELASLFRRGD